MQRREIGARGSGTVRLFRAVGTGLVAGAAGTVVMTIVQMLSLRLRDQEPSDTPVRAVEQLTGASPDDEAARARLNQATHLAYGTGWGVARGLLELAGLHGRAATLAHLAAVWGGALVMLPALQLAPPPSRWGAQELVRDLGFHAVYAWATGAAYDRLAR